MTGENENPFRAPDEEDCYRDPWLHHIYELQFELVEQEFRSGLTKAAGGHPLVILAGVAAFMGPVAVAWYLEEFLGLKMPSGAAPIWFFAALALAFVYVVWKLATLPLRRAIEREVRPIEALAPGYKRLRLTADTIEIDVDQRRYEIAIDKAILRSDDKRYSLILEIERFQILLIPCCAFYNLAHRKSFARALKRRLRKHARVFWTTR